jgi:hypothetical protein
MPSRSIAQPEPATWTRSGTKVLSIVLGAGRDYHKDLTRAKYHDGVKISAGPRPGASDLSGVDPRVSAYSAICPLPI